MFSVDLVLGKKKAFLESAKHIDQVLADRRSHLMDGGGSLGLMGRVCQ